MKRYSKRVKEFSKLIDRSKKYSVEEAIKALKDAPHPKFDESVDLNFKLDMDTKEAPQPVRGTVTLPSGTGKKVRVAVFCKGEAANFAKDAGADHVGGTDLVTKVAGGWVDFDVAIATPEMMKELSRLGKVLGPKGLMPSPKAGTVTDDVAKAVKECKAGKIEFKMDKQANINCAIGKLSFAPDALTKNATVLISAVYHAKPPAAKGQFIKNVSISSSMGPGIRLDISKIVSES